MFNTRSSCRRSHETSFHSGNCLRGDPRHGVRGAGKRRGVRVSRRWYRLQDRAEYFDRAREDLEIDWDRINVRYVFVSSASEPIERTIGFPLAKVSLADGPDGIENRSWSQDEGVGEPHNYMAYKVFVNGEPLTPKLREWAGDTPSRFRPALTVGAYLGLTPR